MKIHELAQKTGLTAPTIRFYEKEGLLDTRHVRRGENNYRDYGEEAVEHLLVIKEVQAARVGMEIVKIFADAKDAAFIVDVPLERFGDGRFAQGMEENGAGSFAH